MNNLLAMIKKGKKQQPFKKPLFSKGNYAYVCTRVKAKRALLFSNDMYLKLLAMDLSSITRFIGEGQYKKEINELALSYSGLELFEYALQKNMAALNHQILGFSKGHLHTMISAYLHRWDIWNIKTILRGKWYKASSQDIMKTVVPAGEYSEQFWKQIIDTSDTITAVIEHLKETPWYATLQPYTTQEFSLSELENKLDIDYYTFLLKMIPSSPKANRLFKNFVKQEIDLLNLKTLFLLKYENVEPETVIKLLIEGGEQSIDDLKGLINAVDFNTFLENLSHFSFYNLIKEEAESIHSTGSLTWVIRALEKIFYENSEKFSYMYPLTILPILNYFIQKEIEVDNLRIIAKGMESKLSEQTIRDMLVI